MARTEDYQFDYSKILPEAVYDRATREKKAQTIVAILRDHLQSDLKSLSLLDVGCSTGFIANYLSDFFGQVIGIDIDEPAIDFAKHQCIKDNLEFLKSDSLEMQFSENTFDVVVCAHIYEHVPDAGLLLDEIYRVLKPGGACYFAAGNRINFMEPHYHLPFLSMLPRPLAHIYVRASRRGNFYYEKHLTYWGLKRLVGKFGRIDYTRKIIQHPERYAADYMLGPNTLKAGIARFIAEHAYALCPTFIWLLQKP